MLPNISTDLFRPGLASFEMSVPDVVIPRLEDVGGEPHPDVLCAGRASGAPIAITSFGHQPTRPDQNELSPLSLVDVVASPSLPGGLSSITFPGSPSPRRGRPPKPRYTCPACGKLSILRQDRCCQHCRRPQHPISKYPRGDWATFLGGFDWTYAGYGTLLPEWGISVENEHKRLAAQDYARRFFHRFDPYDPNLGCFGVWEPLQSGLLHLHWLLRTDTRTLPRSVIRDTWTSNYKGIGEVIPYSPGCSVYTSKSLGRSDLHVVDGTWKPSARR